MPLQRSTRLIAGAVLIASPSPVPTAVDPVPGNLATSAVPGGRAADNDAVTVGRAGLPGGPCRRKQTKEVDENEAHDWDSSSGRPGDGRGGRSAGGVSEDAAGEVQRRRGGVGDGVHGQVRGDGVAGARSAGRNKKLVKKIQQGKATAADLTDGGATQLGTAGDDYAPCADSGQNCSDDIYAVSLPGVTPSAYITWFQAQQACKNAGKRLPSNAEWQAAVAGTPDPGPDNGTTDCNTNSSGVAEPTGSRSSCVSSDGAFDMVGNLYEWVADWVPRSTACGTWSAGVSPTGDDQCLAGAATTGEPGALLRGGDFFTTVRTPVRSPWTATTSRPSRTLIGFRCAR